MNDSDCARFDALAAALALGSLDREDADFARAHLRGCARPHPEVREWLALASAVGAAVPEDDAPRSGLRERVLRAAREHGLERPDGHVARASTPGAARWRRIATALGAFAVAVSVLLAVTLTESRSLRDQLAATDLRVDALATELDDARAWIDRAVARGADTFFMNGEGVAADAHFMLVVEAESAGAVLLMSGLPPLAAGETYELWVERGAAVIGLGTFSPDAAGQAAVGIDGSVAGVRQAMVTVEPSGGSAVPTVDEVVMQGDLAL